MLRCGDQSTIDDEIPGNEPPHMYIVSGEYGAVVFLHVLYFEFYMNTGMKLYLFRDIHNLIRVTACLELYLRSTTIRENLRGGVTEISDLNFSVRRSWRISGWKFALRSSLFNNNLQYSVLRFPSCGAGYCRLLLNSDEHNANFDPDIRQLLRKEKLPSEISVTPPSRFSRVVVDERR